MRHSRMGIGATALGTIAWVVVVGGLTRSTPHELVGIALMVALSGVAVAWEGRRVEGEVDHSLQRFGLIVNISAMAAAIAAIVCEIIKA